MSMRPIAGVVAGLIVWWIQFTVVAFLIFVLWPGSDDLVQDVFEGGDYSVLPTGMLIAFLPMYVAIGLAAGWVTVRIARAPIATWFVAMPIFLFAAFQHLYVLWDNLPLWYNLAVVLIIWPFIVLGGGFRHISPAASA